MYKRQFQLRSSEVTVNIPSLLARKDRYNQWVLVRPQFVTFDSDELRVDPERYAAATSVEQQMRVIKEAAEAYLERRPDFRVFLPIVKKVLWKETGKQKYVLHDDSRSMTFNVRRPDFTDGRVSFEGMLDIPLLGAVAAPDDMWCAQLVEPFSWEHSGECGVQIACAFQKLSLIHI